MQLKRQIFSAPKNNYKVNFVGDKVLNSKIKEKAFDYIFLTEDAFMY
jgi:hypothetical protein